MENKYFEYMLYESEADPVGLPDGVTFLNDQKSEELDDLIQKISTLFRRKKYHKVLPPVFEYYETFEKGSGMNIARRAFSFKDKDGKMLSLRYDMTTPIARMASMKYSDEKLPLRFYYRGDVFREQPIHAGKPRQLRQVGIEHIGESEIDADVEVIDLLGESLSALSDKYVIVMGDIKLYKHLLSQLKLSDSQIKAVNSAFNNKDLVSLKIILDKVEGIKEYKELLLNLPYAVGTTRQINEKLAHFEELGVKHYLDRVLSIMSGIHPEVKKHIILDLGLIKDFSYYSSTTLEGYIDGIGYPVANGGRYDDLFKSFGKDFPAIGFAIDISYTI